MESRTVVNDTQSGDSRSHGPTSRPRWFAPRVDRFLIGLIGLEAFLFLADLFDWFKFNAYPGWTALLTIAIVAGSVLLMAAAMLLGWMRSIWTNRRPPQFGLRSLMLLVTAVAIVLGWCLSIRTAAQRELVAARKLIGIRRAAARLDSPRTPRWLVDSLGEGFLDPVHAVTTDDITLPVCGEFRALRYLEIAPGREIPIDTLSQLAGFDKLVSLAIRYPGAQPDALRVLRRLPRLEHLMLEGDSLSDDGIANIAALPNLKELRIARGWIAPSETRDTMQALIADLPTLPELDPGRVHVTDIALEHLRGLENLESIEFSGARLTGEGLGALTGLKRLTTLRLNDCPLTEAGIKEAGRLAQLRTLILDETPIDDAQLVYLYDLKSLQVLVLRSTNVSPQAIKRLKDALPGCAVYQ